MLMVSVVPFTSFSDAVNPTRAAETLPMVTAMLNQAKSVLSLAAETQSCCHAVDGNVAIQGKIL